MSDILPTGYTSVDLSQTGRTAYTGTVSGVEQGVVVEPLQYPDSEVSGQFYNSTETLTSGGGTVYYRLERRLKAWSLDWIDLSMIISSVATSALTFTFYKLAVGDQHSDLASGDKIGELLSFDPNVDNGLNTIRLACYNLSDQVRLFDPGESLVLAAAFDDTTVTVTEMEVSWLGRTFHA